MLKVFDQNHKAVGALSRYKDLKIESDLETGDKKMTFFVTGIPAFQIRNEYYIQTRYDEFVIKNIRYDGDTSYEAVLNLETLEGTPYDSFSVTDRSFSESITEALDGTGWTLGVCEVPDTDKRNAGMIDCDVLAIIHNLCSVWLCEPEFDSLHKTVNIYRQRGADKGCYFASGLNLRGLEKDADSYDFYTRIIPRGADGLGIGSVNDGKNYLEDHSYSDKVKTLIWKDESYTDPRALKDDAWEYLKELAHPIISLECDVIDLAKQSSKYSVLSYGLGDIVTVIDLKTHVRDKQRIVHLTEYPGQPWKNSCEMASRKLKFTDMLDKRKNAESIEFYDVTNGQLGTTSLSAIINKIKKEQEG